MDAQKPRLPLLEQREIEARIVGPLVRTFASQLGIERTLAIVGEVVRDLARQSGDELARTLGEQALEAFGQSLGRWRENGTLEIDIIEQNPEKLSFNVTRCRYAEMYRELSDWPTWGEAYPASATMLSRKDSTRISNSYGRKRSWEGRLIAISGFAWPNPVDRKSTRL